MDFCGDDYYCRQQGTSDCNTNGTATHQKIYIKPNFFIDCTHPRACADRCTRHLPTTCTVETEESKSTQANMSDIKDISAEIKHASLGLHTPSTPRNDLTTNEKSPLKPPSCATLNEQQQHLSFSNSNGHFDPVALSFTNHVTPPSNGLPSLNWLWPCVVLILAIALVHTNLRVSRLESTMDHLVRTTGFKHEALAVQSEQTVSTPHKSGQTWLSRSTTGRGLIPSFNQGILVRDTFTLNDYLNTIGSRTSKSNKEELGEAVNENEDSQIKTHQSVPLGRFHQSENSDISPKLQISYDALNPHLRTLDILKSSNSDLSTEQDAENRNTGLEDKKGGLGGPNARHSRTKRSSKPCKKLNKHLMDQYCQDKHSQKNDKDKYLTSVQFDAEFYKIYDFTKHFLIPEVECFHDNTWPTKPKVCKEATLEYPDEDSPIALYHRHDNNNNDSANNSSTNKPGHRHRQHKRDLVSITDKSKGVFTVSEPGVYLVHLNITVVDESHNHSLAIFLNGQAVLACPKGGFRCPHSNESKSYKYRICNIDGVLELNKGDSLQVRTLEPKTVIRLESHRKSQLRFILLHPTGKGPKKNKKE